MPSTIVLFTRPLRDGSSQPSRARPVPRLVRAALCALVSATVAFASPASAALPGLELVTVSSPLDSTAAKSATASCPSGKSLIGAGGQLNTSASGRVVLDEVTPVGTSVTAVGAETSIGTTSNWSVTARAICATP